MNKITFKKIILISLLLTSFVLGASFYFQYVKGLVPCPLCMMQRVCVVLLLFGMGLSLRTESKTNVISLWLMIISGAGLFFSLRQLWLQSLPPDQVPACVPGLDILIQYFPWQAVLKALLWGSGDCAEVTWRFFGISMPGWCALYFLLMMLMGYFLLWHTKLSRKS